MTARNIILLLIISLVSCTSKQDSEATQRIEKFESFLGQKETTYLNEIVSDFDRFLELKYNGSGIKHFQLYLNDIEKGLDVEYFIIDSIKRQQYQDSKLFTKFIDVYPDSVWLDGDTVKLKYPGFEKDEYLIAITHKGQTIEEITNDPDQQVTSQSNFYCALEEVSKQDSLIFIYLDIKEGIGSISPSVLADMINLHLDDSSLYFAKRILIMDQFDSIRNYFCQHDGNSQFAGQWYSLIL